MTSDKFGKLKKCDFSDVWKDEMDFSDWLASAEGLAMLGKILDMPLANPEREMWLDGVRADLVCTDANDKGKVVVIENQRGYTDRSHLNQWLLYGARLRATTLVWIAERFSDEHKEILDWLNEISHGVRFFGLEIGLWRIGDSKPAPKLCPVTKPKDSPPTRRGAIGELSEYQKELHCFWNGFGDHLRKAGIGRVPPKNYESLVLYRGIGGRGAWLGVVLRDYRDKLGVKIYFDDPRCFKLLQKQAKEIEAELNCKHKTHWQEPTEDYNKYSFDCVWDANWREKKQRDTIYRDLAYHWQEIDRVFRPCIGNLNLDDWDEDEDANEGKGKDKNKDGDTQP